MDSPSQPKNRGEAPRTPRWLNILGIMALVLILLVGFVLLVGGGHGPARHAPSSLEHPLAVRELGTRP